MHDAPTTENVEDAFARRLLAQHAPRARQQLCDGANLRLHLGKRFPREPDHETLAVPSPRTRAPRGARRVLHLGMFDQRRAPPRERFDGNRAHLDGQHDPQPHRQGVEGAGNRVAQLVIGGPRNYHERGFFQTGIQKVI